MFTHIVFLVVTFFLAYNLQGYIQVIVGKGGINNYERLINAALAAIWVGIIAHRLIGKW